MGDCKFDELSRAAFSAGKQTDYVGRLVAGPTCWLNCVCLPARSARIVLLESSPGSSRADQCAPRGAAGVCDLAGGVRLFGGRLLPVGLWPRRGDADLRARFSGLGFLGDRRAVECVYGVVLCVVAV